MKLTGKQVFITGSEGFIGSHLTEMLVRAGCRVKALVQYNSFNSWGWLDSSPVKHDIEVVTGNIQDSEQMNTVTEGVDVVFHLAALIAIPYSYAAPNSYVLTNVQGTVNVLNAARRAGVEKVIHTSTSEVYGTALRVPIDEEHPIQPQSPYSASKAAADAFAISYHRSFGLPVVIARPFNTYGPRQSARAFIPSCITQIAGGAEVIKVGNIDTTRDLTFVKDTCRGFMHIAEYDGGFGDVINIGSNYEISMRGVLEKLIALSGRNVRIEQEEQRLRPDASEVYRLWCDNTKISQLTGYSPSYNIDQGLEETYRWFADSGNLTNYKGDRYNV